MNRLSSGFITEIAKFAGKIAVEMRERKNLLLDYKNEKDIVSEADRAVEDFIVNEIKDKFPDDSIWGEERGLENKNSDFIWIIDPIDGTTSYIHGQPFFSVSIGLKYKGETIAGAVYAPVLSELFYAKKNSGAFLNGKRICVSKRSRLIESVLSTGFACVRAGLRENNIDNFCRILPHIRGIRRYGSAAIDLSYVACGRLEGFWEMNLKEYDICAGLLILDEAGGKISDFYGGRSYPEKGLLASNGLIHEQILKYISFPKN